jgi:hypothetical protein
MDRKAGAPGLAASFALALLIALGATSDAGPRPEPPREFWVVNTATRSLSVIDPLAETRLAEVLLGGTAEPDSIAFSTIDGHAGAFAFVSQGGEIRLVDTETRMVVGSFPVSNVLPGVMTVVRGLESARLQRFIDDMGTVRTFAFLHGNADVFDGTGNSQPWFLVFDQEALVGLAPGPALVAAGPLAMMPGLAGAQASDVTVLAHPQGDERQRAWHTLRTADRVLAVRVATSLELGPNSWRAREVIETPPGAPGTPPLPRRLTVGAPHWRTTALLPVPTTGTLLNVYLERPACDVGGRPASVAIAGPGPGSYDTFALDADGVLDRVALEDVAGCTTSDSFPTGQTPVDLDTLGDVFFTKALVTNRDSDDVTVVRADGTLNTISLLGPPAPPPAPAAQAPAAIGPGCVKCPSAGRTQRSPETSCSVDKLEVSPSTITWEPIGCVGAVEYIVWCYCDAGAMCPLDCDGTTMTRDTPLPAPLQIGDSPWEPLGKTATTSFPTPPSTVGLLFTVTLDDMLP